MHHHEHNDGHRASPSGERGKHRHGNGPGHRGSRGRHGRGGDGHRIGRMLGDGDLRLIILDLLARESRHGYDIIKALEEHSSGFYSPSPGIVYPTLTFLEEAGYASSAAEGTRKVYTISETGKVHLDENRDLVDAVLSEIERTGRKMSLTRIEGADRRSERAGPDRDIPGALPEVNDARRVLKRAIAEKLDASAEEQRRVASILREAASAIRQSAPEPATEDDIDLG